MPIDLDEYDFEGPYSIETLKDRAGVYLVLTPINQDDHQVLDVDEAPSLKQHIRDHPRSSCWHENAKSEGIFYAVLYTQKMRAAGRKSIVQEIRTGRMFPCGDEWLRGLFDTRSMHWLWTTRQPELAQTFKRWRKGFGLSQEQLAERTGIKLVKIQAVEAGEAELRHRATIRALNFEKSWKKEHGSLPKQAKSISSQAGRKRGKSRR